MFVSRSRCTGFRLIIYRCRPLVSLRLHVQLTSRTCSCEPRFPASKNNCVRIPTGRLVIGVRWGCGDESDASTRLCCAARLHFLTTCLAGRLAPRPLYTGSLRSACGVTPIIPDVNKALQSSARDTFLGTFGMRVHQEFGSFRLPGSRL